MLHILGVGDYHISGDRDDVLRTYALGSCVAVTFYCTKLKILGMAHIVLPDSKIDIEKSRLKPAYFADTALEILLDQFLISYGCKKENLRIELFGGATIGWQDYFDIGQRNIEAIVAILEASGLKYIAVETGGCYSRTVEMDVATGRAKVVRNLLGS